MPAPDEKMNATPEEQVQMLEVHEKDDDGEVLPSPVSASSSRPAASKQQQQPGTKLSAAMIIPIWIVLSSAVIIYNNYLYNTLDFRFPVFLVTWHLTFAVSLRCPPSLSPPPLSPTVYLSPVRGPGLPVLPLVREPDILGR